MMYTNQFAQLCVFFGSQQGDQKGFQQKNWVDAGMPAPEEESGSSESSYEDVPVEGAEPETKALEPTAKGKAAAKKEAAKKEPAGLVELSEESSDSDGKESSATMESLPEESPKLERRDKTPVKAAGKTPAKAENSSRGREADKSGHGRGREPERKTSEKGRGKSKSKSEKGRRACPVCWQKVVDTQAGMEQHQYWCVPCNAWKRHNKGESWENALAAAERQKERRTARFNAQGTASASKPEAPKKEDKKKKKKEVKEETKKKKRRGKATGSKETKGKVEKGKRKPSSSPDPRPAKKEKKGPDTSSDSEGKGSGRGRGKQWTKVWHWVKI